ncbi:energy-coupling factor transporter transmembrane component T family protein [[Clostridium] colinum]|uniref:energy-coupling factor transporter transmembrane component T family protein n=1 Tax=[Clostridium] colinum TaxID=36835 RepID=UPI002024566D|nr:energy-coupling factor transporter transmembrane component T [[Clostridium] colinum]
MNNSLGQFYPTGSVIHNLDARVKIILTFSFLMFIFISKSFIGNFVSLIFLLLVIYLSKIPMKVILKSFKGIMFLLLFTLVTNIFFNQTGEVLFKLGFIKITTGGLLYSGRMIFRLSILIVASSMLTFTTNTLDFADGLESLLKPLKKIKFPSHEISMIITIALRFIPTILEELEKIKKAQMSRGVDFETGGIIKKVKNFVPILIPLFISSFKRADDLAMAMECRCYRGDINRTRLKVLKTSKNDYIAIGCLAFYLLIIVLIRFTIES